jgi:hypothetical protein
MLRSPVAGGLLLCVFVFGFSVASGADDFERHGPTLVKRLAEEEAGVKQLTMNDVSKLKPLAATIGSPCLIVKTGDGGYSKLLATWGYKKGRATDKPMPVLLIERFVTYRGDRLDLTSATGKDVMLVPGFGFDLDMGQVVPEGLGADIIFTSDSELLPGENCKLVALNGSKLPATEKGAKHDPKDHEGVVAQDFSGTWKMNADGRWQGELDLKVTEDGKATGTFTSDESKNSYDITGQTGSLPHNLKMEVFLANTQLSLDVYLWTKDKSQMAGTVTMTGRKFGFVATRTSE